MADTGVLVKLECGHEAMAGSTALAVRCASCKRFVVVEGRRG